MICARFGAHTSISLPMQIGRPFQLSRIAQISDRKGIIDFRCQRFAKGKKSSDVADYPSRNETPGPRLKQAENSSHGLLARR